MDDAGFHVPRFSIQQQSNSPSPPPPTILHKETKKRKRDESMDKSLENNSKKLKLSHSLSSIYSAPSWAQLPPEHYKFELEVIKNGVIKDTIPLKHKTYFIFGRDPSADISTLHPSCSRNHAVLQHRKNGEWLLFDFGSTHYTKLNHKKLHPHKYYKVNIGNIIQFGSSQRMYILNGPKQLQIQPIHSETQTATLPNRKQTQTTMQSMLKQLENQSKQEKAAHNKANKQTTKRKVNVWGMDDTFDDDTNNNEFDENEAKQNRDTKDIYKELQSKRKQHNKLQFHLKQSLSKQRSDKELNQTQCIKIEKRRAKVDDIMYEIEACTAKIANILRGKAMNDDTQRNESYYDNPFDDDDDYYDRIKVIRRKSSDVIHRHALNRNARFSDNKQSTTRGYDSYKDELEHLEMEMSEMEQTLRDIEYRKRINIKDKERLEQSATENQEIDSILNDLKANDTKCNALKRELKALETKKRSVLRMVNILRPAYFKVMETEPDRVNINKDKMKVCTYSPKKSAEAQIKPGSLADIAQKMKREEMKKKEYEESVEKEAQQRVLEREKEIKEAENARIIAMKQLEEEHKKVQQKREELRWRDEQNKDKVGLILYNKNNKNEDNGKRRNALETEFAKIIGNPALIRKGDDDMDEDDMAFVRDADAEFVAPTNQTGDGKTWLNEKYGY